MSQLRRVTLLVALLVLGCAPTTGEVAGNRDTRAGVDAVVTLNTNGQAVSGFDVYVRFDPHEMALTDISPKVPAPLRLHYDVAQFATGTVRLIATVEPAARGTSGAVFKPAGPLDVARLMFTLNTLSRPVDPKRLRWEFVQPRVYGATSAALEIQATFEATLKLLQSP